MPSGNTHPGLSLAGSRQRLRLQVSRCGFTWFSASFFSFTSSPPSSPLLVSRVGVKRAIILMHLFMGVIKISARQRVRESSCAALNEPPTRSLSRSGWSIIGRAISSRNTDSNREDGIAEGRWTKRSQLPDRWSLRVWEVSRFRFLYGTGGCVGVAWKKIFALAGVSCIRGLFTRRGRKKEAMSGKTVTSGVFYWQMKI